MALDSKHPLFVHFAPDWEKMRDCYEGERQIKRRGETYLPPTPGQLADGMQVGETGHNNYEAYKMRARFPGYVKHSTREMIGVMHGKPPVIELPPQLEPLRDRASVDGEGLNALLRRINAEQLTTGRIGLMLDMPKESQVELPYIAPYMAENIINWDDGAPGSPTLKTLNLVVLNETQKQRQVDLDWKDVSRFRVLILGDINANEPAGTYQQAVFEETRDIAPESFFTPELRGAPADFIPFVFINAGDLLPSPDGPPQLELAELSLAIYRQSADYYLGLFAQSQDTVVIESDQPKEELQYVHVGVGRHIHVPIGGSAYYIGVNSAGRPEQRSSLENDRAEAMQLAGQLLDAISRQKESGEALRERVAAGTVTLKDIALNGADGLQRSLRQIAQWKGADESKVIVQANTSFTEAGMTPSDFFQLQAARKEGAPLSDESYHDLLRKHFYTNREFKVEMALIDVSIAKEMARQRELMKLQQPPALPPGEQNGGQQQ